MIDLSIFHSYPVTSKLWGQEILLTNTPGYCAKILTVQPGWQCSLHSHRQKHETFFVLEGLLGVQWGINPPHLKTEFKGPGDPLPLPPGTWHRFWAAGNDPTTFLEVSGHHSDEDVDRLEESGMVGPF